MKKDIYERIEYLIKYLKLNSRKSFAESIGVSYGTINSILGSQRSKPGYDVLVAIKNTLPEISLDWLLVGESPMLKNSTNAQNDSIGNLENGEGNSNFDHSQELNMPMTPQERKRLESVEDRLAKMEGEMKQILKILEDEQS